LYSLFSVVFVVYCGDGVTTELAGVWMGGDECSGDVDKFVCAMRMGINCCPFVTSDLLLLRLDVTASNKLNKMSIDYCSSISYGFHVM